MPRSNLALPRFTDKSVAIAAALEYAQRGWWVLPCYGINRGWGKQSPSACICPLGSACGKNAGKHPSNSHGFHDATCDREIISTWYRDSNIAIATGARSGLFVVDVDPRKGGGATLTRLEAEHGPFPRSAVVFTGGGGLHFYYQYPKTGAPIGSGEKVFGPGVDLKGNGGYVIAPPSLHLSCKRYRWLGGVIPDRLPIAPRWLLKLARTCKVASASGGSPAGSIKTRDHRVGRILAKRLGARDCGHYWSFDCPVGEHETPDAAMYPRPQGQVRFKCFSGNPCSDDQIARAVAEMLS